MFALFLCLQTKEKKTKRKTRMKKKTKAKEKKRPPTPEARACRRGVSSRLSEIFVTGQ